MTLLEDDEDIREQRLTELGILPDMMTKRKIDVAVNKKGHVWVVYDKPFPDKVHWLEFDADLGTLTLVLQNGCIQDLGMKIPEKSHKKYMRAKLAMFAQMKGKEIKKMFPATIVTRSATDGRG